MPEKWGSPWREQWRRRPAFPGHYPLRHLLVTIVEAPDRARSNLELLRATEPQADVIKRQVRLRGDKIEQPLLMLVQRRAAMAGAGLGLDAAGRRPALGPADRRRGTDVEQTCRLPRAVTLLDDRDDPHPQVFRVSLRHRVPPPLSSQEPNLICTPEGTPYDPSDSNQTESALASRNAVRQGRKRWPPGLKDCPT